MEYLSYGDVPQYRKQWVFWLSWFFCQPVAILILITGEVYYPKEGVVTPFGPANRVVAGIFGLLYLSAIADNLAGG